jgi:hypothetical protein
VLVVEQQRRPFPYLLADECLPVGLADALLDWFERDAPWALAKTNFYEQYEFNLLDAEQPASVRGLLSPIWLDRCRATMEQAFGTPLEARQTLVAHKLVGGQRIAIHNDFIPGGETHRLTIQLNRGLRDEDGGLFMLFNSFDPSDIHRILRPANGTGVAFAIGASSHHAVSKIHGGERFTLVFSYHAAADPALD